MEGQLVHFELPSEDGARARCFWSNLFGWAFRDAGLPGGEYWLTRTGEHQGGAVLPREAGEGGGITVYFECDDIAASIARARELGGEAGDPVAIPRVGWIARCRDTEGNAFRLFQSDESAG
jgi:predicted enzyme related to lactoylglutathione lyase